MTELTRQIVAIDKHANYWSNDACNDGAVFTDVCDATSNIDWQVTYGNAGEIASHRLASFPATVLPYPATDDEDQAEQSGASYEVWGGEPFGESTAQFEQLAKGFMTWSRNCVQRQPFDGSVLPMQCY